MKIQENGTHRGTEPAGEKNPQGFSARMGNSPVPLEAYTGNPSIWAQVLQELKGMWAYVLYVLRYTKQIVKPTYVKLIAI